MATRAPSGMAMAQIENARMINEETTSTIQLVRDERCSSSSSGPLLRSLRDTGVSSSIRRPGRRWVPPKRVRSRGGGPVSGEPSCCAPGEVFIGWSSSDVDMDILLFNTQHGAVYGTVNVAMRLADGRPDGGAESIAVCGIHDGFRLKGTGFKAEPLRHR